VDLSGRVTRLGDVSCAAAGAACIGRVVARSVPETGPRVPNAVRPRRSRSGAVLLSLTGIGEPASRPKSASMRVQTALRSMLAKLLLNRWSIVVFNALIALPLTLALVEVASLLWGTGFRTHATIHEAGHLIEGMGVILIGWGVVLEERHGVSHLLGGLPSEDPEHEAAIDALCHHGGLALLVLGLVAEILVQCVEVPDHIINTDRIERVVLTGGAVFLAFGLATLVRLSAGLATFRGPAPASAGASLPEAHPR